MKRWSVSRFLVSLLALSAPEHSPLEAAERDCNGNGVEDAAEIARGASPDCNDNGVPDECDVRSAEFGFEGIYSLDVSASPLSIVGADLDGDGDTDLATGNGLGHVALTPSVMLNLTYRPHDSVACSLRP